MTDSAITRIQTRENLYSGSQLYKALKFPFETISAWLNASANTFTAISRWPLTHNVAELAEHIRQYESDLYTGGQSYSRDVGRLMYQLGSHLGYDEAVNRELNYGFFTHNRLLNAESENGSLNRQDGETIAALFAPDVPPEQWPNLLLTSSHALVADHHDVSGIMKGFHALAAHLFHPKGVIRHLPLIMRENDSPHPENREGKQTMLLSSVYNDGNALRNGGSLILRLRHLDELYELEQNHAGQTETGALRAEREKAYLGLHRDNTEMSPASVRIAKLMLKVMVAQSDRVHIPGREYFESHDWKFFPERSFESGPLTLRPDAREVLQHIKLLGYSKGGNIMTDALRYLVLELQHGHVAYQDRDTSPRPMTDDDIHSLMINCGILAINPGISPLTDREKHLGIRRLSVRNERDFITAHLFERQHIRERDGTNDDIYVVSPGEHHAGLGHRYQDAFGNLDSARRGYLTDPAQVKGDRDHFLEMQSRLKCFLASCYNAVGIKSVHPQADGFVLEFSAGASEEQGKQTVEAILRALHKRKRGVSFHHDYDWYQGCDFTVTMHEDGPVAAFPAELLGEALKEVEQRRQRDVVVGHNVYRDLGVDPPMQAQRATRTA